MQPLRRRDQTQRRVNYAQLLEELLRCLDANGIFGVERGQLGDHLSNVAHKPIVLDIVFALLDVIAPQDRHLPKVLQRSEHDGDTRCSARRLLTSSDTSLTFLRSFFS